MPRVRVLAAPTTALCAVWLSGWLSNVENWFPSAPRRLGRSLPCPGLPCTESMACKAVCWVANPATVDA